MPISSHASRWLVAAIAAPVVLIILFAAPPAAYLVLLALAGSLAWWEYGQAVMGDAPLVVRLIGIGGWLVTAAGSFWFGTSGQQAGLFIAMGAGALYFVLTFGQATNYLETLGRFALGHAYISLFFSFFLRLYVMQDGPFWVFLLLASTMISDTGAFYAGRSLGRHPLHPVVSPKKTWEGLFGGVVGGAVTALIVGFLATPMNAVTALILGAIIGLWGTVGDLFESTMKRTVGVKDSGRLLMGHGGVWDRIDSLLFNVPVVFFFALAHYR